MKHRPRKPFGKPGARDGRGNPPKSAHQGDRRERGDSRRDDRPDRGPRGESARPARDKGSRLNIDLFGTHAVQAAWKNPGRFIHTLYITQDALKDFDLDAPAKRPAPTVIAKEELDRALPPGTVHQGVALSAQALEESSIDDLIRDAQQKDKSLLLILDQVTDPHNIGAILRSACAFGANGMVLQRKHAPEVTGVMAKIACGALEYVPMAYETNLSRSIEQLQEAGYFVIGLDEHGEKTIAQLPSYDKCALVLGAEGPGLRRLIKENCDTLARLPMKGEMPSINVSNAAAVALYELAGRE